MTLVHLQLCLYMLLSLVLVTMWCFPSFINGSHLSDLIILVFYYFLPSHFFNFLLFDDVLFDILFYFLPLYSTTLFSLFFYLLVALYSTSSSTLFIFTYYYLILYLSLSFSVAWHWSFIAFILATLMDFIILVVPSSNIPLSWSCLICWLWNLCSSLWFILVATSCWELLILSVFLVGCLFYMLFLNQGILSHLESYLLISKWGGHFFAIGSIIVFSHVPFSEIT